MEKVWPNHRYNPLPIHVPYGRDGFEWHVALSIVATNIHRIGLLLQRNALAYLKRAEHRKKAA